MSAEKTSKLIIDRRRVREHLDSRGLRLYDLAGAMGVRQSTLSMILHSKSPVSTRFIISVHALTGLQPGDYLTCQN